MKNFYSVLQSADTNVLQYIYTYDFDELYSYATDEGSDRFVVSLDNGWMVKAPICYRDSEQSKVEWDMYNNLDNAKYYSPAMYTTPTMLEYGVLLVQQAMELEYAIYKMLGERPYYDLEIQDIEEYVIELAEYLNLDAGNFYAEWEGLCEWVDANDVYDTHLANFGILDGRIVMIDLGYGSGSYGG